MEYESYFLYQVERDLTFWDGILKSDAKETYCKNKYVYLITYSIGVCLHIKNIIVKKAKI